MNLPEVPLFSMLRTRMRWLNQRQDVLAQNVANADTPAYVARDLRALDFEKALQGETGGGRLTITNVRHIAVTPSQAGAFEDYETPDQESTPDGNAVSLETEMIKVSDTQAQFQAAANIYAKTMSMMRTAIGH